jgi:hypothetical protein
MLLYTILHISLSQNLIAIINLFLYISTKTIICTYINFIKFIGHA